MLALNLLLYFLEKFFRKKVSLIFFLCTRCLCMSRFFTTAAFILRTGLFITVITVPGSLFVKSAAIQVIKVKFEISAVHQRQHQTQRLFGLIRVRKVHLGNFLNKTHYCIFSKFCLKIYKMPSASREKRVNFSKTRRCFSSRFKENGIKKRRKKGECLNSGEYGNSFSIYLL